MLNKDSKGFNENTTILKDDDSIHLEDAETILKSGKRSNSEIEPEEHLYFSESEQMIRRKIKNFIQNNSFKDFYGAIQERVIGQDELSLVLINVWTYLSNISEGKTSNSNIIIAAPSGCGKTETFRAIRDYFEKNRIGIPVAQVDMTSITEEGFAGKNTDDFLSVLCENKNSNGVGIIFMDEIDKKIMPSYSSSGDNVNLAVQNQILTVIEGCKREMSSRILRGRKVMIDTNNTMFIGLGAFDVCRKKRQAVRNVLGFAKELQNDTARFDANDHFSAITRKDMIDLGASYEFIGRFGTIVNYSKLERKHVEKILEKYVDKEIEIIGVPIILTSNAVDEFCEMANSKYGCRMIVNTLNETVMRCLAKLKLNGSEDDNYMIMLESASEANYQLYDCKKDVVH